MFLASLVFGAILLYVFYCLGSIPLISLIDILLGGGTGWGRGRVGGGEGLVMAKAWGRGVSGFIYVWSHAYAFGGRYLGFFRLLDHVVLLGFHRKLTKFVVHLVK